MTCLPDHGGQKQQKGLHLQSLLRCLKRYQSSVLSSLSTAVKASLGRETLPS